MEEKSTICDIQVIQCGLDICCYECEVSPCVFKCHSSDKEDYKNCKHIKKD